MAKMLDNRGTTSKIFQIGRETALKSTDDSLEVVSAQFPAERKDFRASTATFEGLVLPNALLNATDNRFTKNPISNGYELVNGDKRTTLTVDQETGTVESSDGFGIKHSGYVSNAILGFKAPASVSGMKITMPAGFNVNYSDGRDLYDENNNPNGKGGLKSYNSITDAEYTVTVAPTGGDETVSYHALFDETAKELFYVSKDQLYYGIKVPTAEDGYLVRRDSNGNDYYRLIDGVWVKRHIIRVASFDLTDGKTMDNFEPCYPCDLLKLTDYLVADSGGGGSQQAAVRSMEIPASDSETSSIALDYACYDKNAMLVLIEHTVVPPTTYELSSNGKTLTFNTPIPAGMRIDLRWFSNIEVIKVDIPLASDTEFMQGTSDVLAPTVRQVHQYNGTKLPLFYPSRFPWVANNIEWLRADTFSWQSGKVYSAAYAELVSIYNAEGSANETETIGAYTITYKRCANGMKIADASQQNVIMDIYAATGSAFYFILDLGNSRFKLPRTKYSLVGYEDGLGNYVSSEASTGNGVKVAGNQSYLYFYMGTFNQSAIDNTAGLNTELFAGKADVDYVQNNYVDKTSTQTISGSKHFTQPSEGMSIELTADTNQQTVPAEPTVRQLGLYRNATYSKGDGYTSWLQGTRGSDGWTATELYVRRFLESDSQEIINYIRVNITPEGTPITYTKTPPASSAGDEIVTAAWVKSNASQLQPGTIIMYGGTGAPIGNWLPCNGAAISRTTYANLFSAVGTKWGAGDGSTTFNVPNFTDAKIIRGNNIPVYGSGKGLRLTNNASNVGGYMFQHVFDSGAGEFDTSIYVTNYASDANVGTAQSGGLLPNNVVLGVPPKTAGNFNSGLQADLSNSQDVLYYIQY